VLLDGTERGEPESLADLALRRRDPIAIAVLSDEIQDLLLALGEVHRLSDFSNVISLFFRII
jgi:hypothetical protein